jgi:hypothetical protein
MNELQIAAYLDRGLSSADRDKVEDHLADCADCRAEVLETQQLVKRVRRPRRTFIGVTIIAAAAVTLFMVKTPFRASDRGSNAVLVRNGGTELTIVAYGPTGEVRSPIRFIWAPLKDAMTYHLTVSRTDAVPVWSQSGTDTVVNLPDSVSLRVGQHYYWVADALLSDGSSRSTGLREFGPVR